MNTIATDQKPRIRTGLRLQYEPAQQAHVMLYPEGMVKLNASAAAILARCDGGKTIDEIVVDLESTFQRTDLRRDIEMFIEGALQKGWLES